MSVCKNIWNQPIFLGEWIKHTSKSKEKTCIYITRLMLKDVTIDFYLSRKRDAKTAKHFLESLGYLSCHKNLLNNYWWWYILSCCDTWTKRRKVYTLWYTTSCEKYLNTIIEQDYQFIKIGIFYFFHISLFFHQHRSYYY